MLPCLEMGMPIDVFWKQTFRSLHLFFKAKKKAKENEWKEIEQKAWLMGMYVKSAINSSVFPVGLYDKKITLPKYPDMPHTKFENNSNEQDEQWVNNERLRCYAFFKSFGKHK